eukprot:Colp12_sorted_trinity150504_noHs@4187
MVQIIWTLTGKNGNDGFSELPSVLCSELRYKNNEADSAVKVQNANLETLMTWCKDNGFVKHPTELAECVGIKMLCYAQPYKASLEHKGKNNIIATFMTCRKANGLAPNTIIGRAVFIRLDPETDAPVDFEKNEFLRLGFCINDLMDVYGDHDHREIPSILNKVKQAFPYYDPVNRGDTMCSYGFQGSGRRHYLIEDNGQVDKSPGDFKIVDTFPIKKAE